MLYTEMKGEMEYERVGRKRLLISRLREKYFIRGADLRMWLFIYIFFFAYLIPCQRMHHPSSQTKQLIRQGCVCLCVCMRVYVYETHRENTVSVEIVSLEYVGGY